jgi:hypothetical protein
MKKEKFFYQMQCLCVIIGIVLIVVFSVDIIYLFKSCKQIFQDINGFYYLAKMIVELLFIIVNFKVANYIYNNNSNE